MTDIQKLVDAFSTGLRASWSDYHVTLGKLISVLERADQSALVRFHDSGAPGREHSYRGFYDDLAFDPDGDGVKVGHFLEQCKKALGNTYEGWKGGDYVMDARTPLWRAFHGDCGDAIVLTSTDASGNVILHCKPDDE